MLKTPNLKLNKPEGSDIVNIADLNENMDILDTNFSQMSKTIKDHGNDEKNPHNVTSEQVNYADVNSYKEEDPITAYPLGLTICRANLSGNNWAGYTANYANIETQRNFTSSHGVQRLTIYRVAGSTAIYERTSTGVASNPNWSEWKRIVTEDMIVDATPSGIISMWSGAINTIPSGWALCDGTSGTPNLVDRFIVGAGAKYEVGDTGGADSVVLTTAQMPSHSHGKGTLATNTTGAHTHEYNNKVFAGTTGVRLDWSGDGPGVRDEASTTKTSGSHSHTISGSTASSGIGQAHENRPPYYALAYIMKL